MTNSYTLLTKFKLSELRAALKELNIDNIKARGTDALILKIQKAEIDPNEIADVITSKKQSQTTKTTKGSQVKENLSRYLQKDSFIKLTLYNSLMTLNQPTYSNLIDFSNSFGIKTDEFQKILLSKIRDKDVRFFGEITEKYIPILEFFIQNPQLSYPLTYKIVDLKNLIPFYDSIALTSFIHTLNQLQQENPDLVNISSSHPNLPMDIVMFRNIFPLNTSFSVNGRWSK